MLTIATSLTVLTILGDRKIVGVKATITGIRGTYADVHGEADGQ